MLVGDSGNILNVEVIARLRQVVEALPGDQTSDRFGWTADDFESGGVYFK